MMMMLRLVLMCAQHYIVKSSRVFCVNFAIRITILNVFAWLFFFLCFCKWKRLNFKPFFHHNFSGNCNFPFSFDVDFPLTQTVSSRNIDRHWNGSCRLNLGRLRLSRETRLRLFWPSTQINLTISCMSLGDSIESYVLLSLVHLLEAFISTQSTIARILPYVLINKALYQPSVKVEKDLSLSFIAWLYGKSAWSYVRLSFTTED